MKSWYVLQKVSLTATSFNGIFLPDQSPPDLTRCTLTLIHGYLIIMELESLYGKRFRNLEEGSRTSKDSAPTPRPAIHLPTTTAIVSS